MTITMIGPYTTSAATGGAGAAAGTVTTGVIRGRVLGIYVQYNDSPPATTDVGVSAQGVTGVLPTIPLLTVSNANTNGYFTPRKNAVDASGAAIAGVYDLYCINHAVKIDVAQANDGDSASVWFWLEK